MRASNGRGTAAIGNLSARGTLALAVAATACVATASRAADITRTPAAGALNLTSSWDTGTIPTAADVAVWDTGSAATGALGQDQSWLGIRIGAGAVGTGTPAAISISGPNVLTLGASGIDMSAATTNLTIQPTISTTTGINLGAAQTWSVNSGRLLSVANSAGAITGGSGATITKTGAGTAYFNSALSTFAGGVTITQGAATVNTNSTVAGNVVTAGPLGTGVVTLNGGTLSTNTTSGRDLANDVNVTADSTIGLAGTARIRSAGTWNLGGVQRTLTLTNAANAFTSNSEQFSFILQATTKTFTLSNGTLRFVNGTATPSAATPTLVNFNTSGGAVFTGNSGVTLGANVTANVGSTQGNVNSPTLTLEAGSALFMSSGTQTKNFTAATLNGAGVVGSGQTDGTTSLATLTINGASGTGAFSGTIQDVYNAFGSAFTGVAVAVQKTAGATQSFSGANTYTGTTSITGGTLRLASTNAQLAATGAVTIGGGTLDSSVANANVGGSTTLNTGTVSPNAGGVGAFTFVLGKNFTMAGGTWAETIASAGNFDQLLGTAAGAFSATGGTLDLSSSTGINYAATYQLVNGFGSVAISGLTITGYNTAAYTASLSSTGLLSFTATAVPEPTTLAALAGVGAVLRRRRR